MLYDIWRRPQGSNGQLMGWEHVGVIDAASNCSAEDLNAIARRMVSQRWEPGQFFEVSRRITDFQL